MEDASRDTTPGTDRKKKKIRIAFAILLAAGAVMTALYFVPYDKLLDRMFSREMEETSEDIFFYEKDYVTDILSDPEYTALNRYVDLTFGVETFTVTDGDFSKYGHACETVAAYLNAMISGDADAYGKLFTDEYYQTHARQDRFPMQRLYDIKVRLQSEHTFTDTELDGKYEGVTQRKYLMEYCIQYNDGSIRRDIGSGVSAPIVLELLTDPQTNETKINSISEIRVMKGDN